MSKFLLICLSALISSFLVGCGGASPQPTSKNEMPTWYLSEVPVDSVNFYGVGEGSSKEIAKSNALAQISGKISTTVESAMDITVKDSTTDGYFKETKSNLKSSTDSIKFTGISVIETSYVNGKFYTYLKVNRAVLFNSLKSDIDNGYNKAQTLFKQMKSKGSIELIKKSSKLTKLIDGILSKPTIEILKSINPKFKSTQYRVKILAIKTDLENSKANVIVYVKSNGNLATYYANIVKKYVSSHGLTMVSSLRGVQKNSNLLFLDISVEAKKKNVKTSDPRLRGATFAAVTIVLTSKDYKGKIEAQNRIDVVNISKDGLKAAKIKTKKFEREIKRQGILNILLKTKK